MSVFYGTGSWTDDEYVGLLYPPGTPSRERLRLYSERFDFVEVNSTYYATPKRETIAQWVKQTRDGFLFHLKLHRAVSQSPHKAATEGTSVDLLLKAAAPLIEAQRLGVFFLVLPPTFAPSRHALDELDAVARKLRPHPLAIELRHRAWVDARHREETLAYFRERELVWIAVDMPRLAESSLMPAVDAATHPNIAYVRLHGRNRAWLSAKSAAERHLYDYKSADLAQIRRRVKVLAKQASNVFVVANNHARDFAPKAALALRERR